jgi:hypothetical protein
MLGNMRLKICCEGLFSVDSSFPVSVPAGEEEEIASLSMTLDGIKFMLVEGATVAGTSVVCGCDSVSGAVRMREALSHSFKFYNENNTVKSFIFSSAKSIMLSTSFTRFPRHDRR